MSPLNYNPETLSQEQAEDLHGYCPTEETRRIEASGCRLFGPPVCITCNRDTIPMGPSDYPRRCPRCGTRWHQVLSKEQDLQSRSNVEFRSAPGNKTEGKKTEDPIREGFRMLRDRFGISTKELMDFGAVVDPWGELVCNPESAEPNLHALLRTRTRRSTMSENADIWQLSSARIIQSSKGLNTR